MSRFKYSNAQQECFCKQVGKRERNEIAQNKKINDQLMEIRKTSSKVHAKLQHGNY